VILNDGSAGFEGGFQSVTVAAGSHADITETVYLASPAVLATSVGEGLYQILLGTFRFTAGATDGQTTLIQATDIPNASETVTNDGLAIDDQIVSSAISGIQVGPASVPEPSSVIVLTIGMIGLGCRGIVLRFKSCNPH
jgi:PEP-CTERM motif